MKLLLALFTALYLILAAVNPAHAYVSLDGYLIAEQECPAFVSIKKQTNPGDVKLTPDMAYELLGKNKSEASHYQVKIKGIAQTQRWVATSCGKLLFDCKEQKSAHDPGDDQGNGDDENGGGQASSSEYLLAISWQPAFCQTHQTKNECETQTADRFDATHFSLHGLWPQPRGNVYCNVSNQHKNLDKNKAWSQLPALGLSDSTMTNLSQRMPGVASFLQRHEWFKHGTCYSEHPEEYYVESLSLIDQLNDSLVRELFAANIGNSISAGDIRAKFDEAFGAGAGSKVKIKCSSGMIGELWINLKGEIDADTKLHPLMQAAPDASGSCGGGIVDAAGF